MNKKIRVLSMILVLAMSCGMLFSQASYEKHNAGGDFVPVRLGVMQGPTGFSSVGLNRSEGVVSDFVKVELSVYPSPNEVIARLASGDLDMAALPTNVAANLYNKGVGVRLAAVVGEGMLSVISSDPNILHFSDLYGTTLAVPGANGTPDQVSSILAKEAQLVVGSDIIFDYSVAAPAQLAQMVIGGKIPTAILPEPFVTMVLRQNPQVHVAADVQALWENYIGPMNYPMSVLVVSDAFRNKYPMAWQQVLEGYSESVAWVNSNYEAAGQAIEETGIMKAAMATPAIVNSALVFRTAQEAKHDVNRYFETLYAFNPASIGGKVPDAAFYL